MSRQRTTPSKNNQKYKQDVRYGGNEENKILPILEAHFKLKLEKTSRYDTFDYFNHESKVLIELKSRRIPSNEYPTSMIGANKIAKGLIQIAEGYSVYFVFNYTDRIICYQLTESFKTEWIRDSGRKDRGMPEIKSYAFIPNTELININPQNYTGSDIEPQREDQRPTMNNLDENKTDAKPQSFTQRLISEFKDVFNDRKAGSFDMPEIRKIIEEFDNKERQARKQKPDEMPFGKYKGRKVAEVANFDMQYLRWLVRQDMMTRYSELKEEITKHLK